MRISISNIAWDKKDDEQIYRILQEQGIHELDVAPARVFDNPMEVSKEQGQEFIKSLEKYGLKTIGMQSLLFGTNGLVLFEDESTRNVTIQHLKKMMDYATKIGVTRLVFGSPKNRLVKGLSKEKVDKLCYEVFNELGNYAFKRNIYFCIEPNPVAYGADFITNTMEGIELVKRINNPGFRLHMDLGTMIMNNEDIEEVVKEGIDVTEHVHLSHPNLEQVVGYTDQHERLYRALITNGYNKTVSIEMKNSGEADNIKKVEETIVFIKGLYGGGKSE